MEAKNNKPAKASDNKKKRPGMAGGMAAVAGAGLGAAAFVGATTFVPQEPDLEGDLIEEEPTPETEAETTTDNGGNNWHRPEPSEEQALVVPEDFDPNEIVLDLDELQIVVEPNDVANEIAYMSPITAEELIADPNDPIIGFDDYNENDMADDDYDYEIDANAIDNFDDPMSEYGDMQLEDGHNDDINIDNTPDDYLAGLL